MFLRIIFCLVVVCSVVANARTPPKSPTTSASARVTSAIDNNISKCQNGTGPPNLGTMRKSMKKCWEYSQFVCTWEDQPILLLDRKKNLLNHCPWTVQTLIVGGEEANVNEFPHMALIGFEEDGAIAWRCGGSVISERYILSAAHCNKLSSGKMWAVVGISRRSEADKKKQEIESALDHPEYKKQQHDLVLFKLKSALEFGETVRPICLHTSTNFKPGVKVVATGWGRLQNGGSIAETLMKVELDLFKMDECKLAYVGLSNGIDSDSMICTFTPGQDTCQGDSGGPIQVKLSKPYCMYSLVGVTAFGKKCGYDSPAVFTRVSHYLNWIESIVWP